MKEFFTADTDKNKEYYVVELEHLSDHEPYVRGVIVGDSVIFAGTGDVAIIKEDVDFDDCTILGETVAKIYKTSADNLHNMDYDFAEYPKDFTLVWQNIDAKIKLIDDTVTKFCKQYNIKKSELVEIFDKIYGLMN